MVTPVVLSFSAVWVHYLPSDERFHRWMAVTVAGLGGLAAVSGYRRHRRARVLVLMGGGLSLIFAGAGFGNLMPSHWAEIVTTMCGSCLMITAHMFNHTFCKKCDRCDHDTSKE
jgi:CHASE2 domain-containing sensor protein